MTTVPASGPWWDIRKSAPYVLWVTHAAALAAGWAIAQTLVVDRLKADLEKQTKVTTMSPVLSVPTLTREITPEGLRVNQFFSFRDPEGDTRAISFVILQTDSENIKVTSESVQIDKDEQVSGTFWRGPWRCGHGHGYTVKVRAYMSDAGGNVSLPVDYVIDCVRARDAPLP